MPVLSQTPSLPVVKVTYLLLGFLLLVSVGIFISRRNRSSQPPTTPPPPYTEPEKSSLFNDEPQTVSPTKNRMAYPTQPPPPLSPPTFYSGGESQFYYSPTEIGGSFSSFEPVDIPTKRRSYTKNIPGGEVSGEIVVNDTEGWRRHTRVYGGGVCLACEESERKMSA